MTPFRAVLIGILGLTIVLLGYRFVVGIGAPTNLTDK